MEQEMDNEEFLERFGPRIYKMLTFWYKRCIFDEPGEIEIRLPFYRSFSTFWDVSVHSSSFIHR